MYLVHSYNVGYHAYHILCSYINKKILGKSNIENITSLENKTMAKTASTMNVTNINSININTLLLYMSTQSQLLTKGSNQYAIYITAINTLMIQ